MGVQIKNPAEIISIKKSGKILARVLNETLIKAVPGVSTHELDIFAEKIIRDAGGTPAFKGYKGFPGTICIGLNEIIVHGIPKKDLILKEGDIFTIDCGVIFEKMYTDAARTIGIGQINEEKSNLIKIAYQTLEKAIKNVKPGIKIHEVSKIIQKEIEGKGYRVIKDLTGHGVGRKLHEEPVIYNYFNGKKPDKFIPGMTVAIEPIFSIGTEKMITGQDGWTLSTKDGSLSVQVEDTILITESGNEILTRL